MKSLQEQVGNSQKKSNKEDYEIKGKCNSLFELSQ